MGTPGHEFQDLNADHQRSCTPRKRGKLAMQNGIAPVSDDMLVGVVILADDRQLRHVEADPSGVRERHPLPDCEIQK